MLAFSKEFYDNKHLLNKRFPSNDITRSIKLEKENSNNIKLNLSNICRTYIQSVKNLAKDKPMDAIVSKVVIHYNHDLEKQMKPRFLLALDDGQTGLSKKFLKLSTTKEKRDDMKKIKCTLSLGYSMDNMVLLWHASMNNKSNLHSPDLYLFGKNVAPSNKYIKIYIQYLTPSLTDFGDINNVLKELIYRRVAYEKLKEKILDYITKWITENKLYHNHTLMGIFTKLIAIDFSFKIQSVSSELNKRFNKNYGARRF
jgi:hypothetical protein